MEYVAIKKEAFDLLQGKIEEMSKVIDKHNLFEKK